MRWRWLPGSPGSVPAGAPTSTLPAAWPTARLPLSSSTGPIAIVLTAVVAIILGVLVALLFPLLFTLVELLVAVVLLPLGVGMRVLLGEPWVIVARTSGPPPERRFTSVVGWQASRDAIQQIAGALSTGSG